MRIYLITYLVCLSFFSFAQDVALDNITEPAQEKKKLSLSFRFDYGINKPLFLDTRHIYKGEFLDRENANDWIWKEEEKPIIPNIPTLKQTNFKFDLMLSTFKNLNIGLSYKLLYDRYAYTFDPSIPFMRGYVFFSICGTVDYEYELPFVKNLYVNPSASIGFYQDDYLYGTTGKKIYYDAKLALFYRLFDKLGIRAWASYDHFVYRKNNPSEVFEGRDRIEKVDFKYINYGLGLSYRFFIYPD